MGDRGVKWLEANVGKAVIGLDAAVEDMLTELRENPEYVKILQLVTEAEAPYQTSKLQEKTGIRPDKISTGLEVLKKYSLVEETDKGYVAIGMGRNVLGIV